MDRQTDRIKLVEHSCDRQQEVNSAVLANGEDKGSFPIFTRRVKLVENSLETFTLTWEKGKAIS